MRSCAYVYPTYHSQVLTPYHNRSCVSTLQPLWRPTSPLCQLYYSGQWRKDELGQTENSNNTKNWVESCAGRMLRRNRRKLKNINVKKVFFCWLLLAFTVRVGRHWTRLPREIVEGFADIQDQVGLGSELQMELQVLLSLQETWTRQLWRIPSNRKDSMKSGKMQFPHHYWLECLWQITHLQVAGFASSQVKLAHKEAVLAILYPKPAINSQSDIQEMTVLSLQDSSY